VVQSLKDGSYADLAEQVDEGMGGSYFVVFDDGRAPYGPIDQAQAQAIAQRMQGSDVIPASQLVAYQQANRADAMKGSEPMEADNLSTFEEGRCNMSEAGTSCPTHGMMECGMEESVMHGDYAEEKSRMRRLAGMQDEGAEGTTGQIIKKLLDPLSQGLAGGGGKSLSTPLVGEEEIEEGPDTFKPGTDTKASYALQKGLETVPFATGGAIGGAALGAIAGAALTGNPNIAAAGLGAGAVTGAQAGKKVADNAIYANDGSWRPTEEGWKGELAGGTVGTLAGSALGAFGGMPGSIVGGAIGGTAGKMIGDKLGGDEETNESDTDLFNDATCNMTEAGENCPVHGLKECNMEEDLDTDGVMMTRQSNMSSESVDPELSRMKSLAGILIR
jgi:hypothetical protein